MVFDTAEHLVPVVMAILRAESVWEIPVLGKLLASGAEKRMVAAKRETEEFIASSFGPWDPDGDDQTRAGVGDGPPTDRPPTDSPLGDRPSVVTGSSGPPA